MSENFAVVGAGFWNSKSLLDILSVCCLRFLVGDFCFEDFADFFLFVCEVLDLSSTFFWSSCLEFFLEVLLAVLWVELKRREMFHLDKRNYSNHKALKLVFMNISIVFILRRINHLLALF